ASAFGAQRMLHRQVEAGGAPLTQETLEQFWHEMYPSAEVGIADHTAGHTNVYTYEVLAKATPDECFYGLDLPPIIVESLPDCEGGISKVNEAYVWGLTGYENTLWFGTAPNVHCLVMGGYLDLTMPIAT